jgi:hypothetical protein
MGDANTNFFHSCANGRRRKTKICSMETDNGIITEQNDICQHVVNYYKQLFGSSHHKGVHLSLGFLPQEEQLSDAQKLWVNQPFSQADVKKAIEGMKSESAPGPNGFTATFFKSLWQYIKKELLSMMHDFNKCELDLRRLNFGVITLVPKVKDANTIKQYRPICLLNVDFKIFTKLLNDRITSIANKLISPTQTAFIKGRNVLEGVVILHEVIHELKRSKKKGVLFKIDFEKAYDKVKWNFVQEVIEKKVSHYLDQTGHVHSTMW